MLSKAMLKELNIECKNAQEVILKSGEGGVQRSTWPRHGFYCLMVLPASI